jgi:hypothetical protein
VRKRTPRKILKLFCNHQGKTPSLYWPGNSERGGYYDTHRSQCLVASVLVNFKSMIQKFVAKTKLMEVE